MRKCASIAVLFMFLVGCSSRKQLTVEDAKSQLTAAVSLAATVELSIGRADAGATTTSFDSGNLEYLRQEVEDTLKEFDKKQPAPDAQAAAGQCRDDLTKLRDEISQLQSNLTQDQRSQSKTRVHAIRESLQRTRATL